MISNQGSESDSLFVIVNADNERKFYSNIFEMHLYRSIV